MDERREMRASDADRQSAVERLRVALNEGRLNLHEYDERLMRAYQSVTYGDLAKVFADLPAAEMEPKRDAAPRPFVPKKVAAAPGVLSGLPTWIRVLWTIWLTVVSINVAVWLLVSFSSGDLVYFWPMWVAGPLGAGLLGLSVGVTAVRRSRRAADTRRRAEGIRRRLDEPRRK